jgi:hypothetical protein
VSPRPPSLFYSLYLALALLPDLSLHLFRSKPTHPFRARRSPSPKLLRPLPFPSPGNNRPRRSRSRTHRVQPLLVNHLAVTGEPRSVTVKDHRSTAPPPRHFRRHRRNPKVSI